MTARTSKRLAAALSRFRKDEDLRWLGWKETAEPGKGSKVELLWLLPSLIGDLECSHRPSRYKGRSVERHLAICTNLS